MSQKTVLTGDRPSGRLHLGHYIGSLRSRVELQNTMRQYVMIADIQALTDNFEKPQRIRAQVMEVGKDYIAAGLDPKRSILFIQSLIPALTELTVLFLNLVTMSRLGRNPTVKTEIRQKNFGASLPVGFFCYPISQAADITAFQADLVPVGEDQLPMIEQTNEIVRRFNRLYETKALKECQAVLSKTGRLIGIDGKTKASKSLNNCIFLGDSKGTIKSKIQSMYTDPKHIKVEDPGSTKGNVVFAYLDAFFDDKEELERLKRRYRKGGLGDGVVKALLNDTLQKLLEPIREKREALQDKDVLECLLEGSRKANQTAAETLLAVKEAMHLTYTP